MGRSKWKGGGGGGTVSGSAESNGMDLARLEEL